MTDKEIEAVLDYYGANLDDSGEPDEAPEAEGFLTLPTPDEEEQERKDWQNRVQSWNGGKNL